MCGVVESCIWVTALGSHWALGRELTYPAALGALGPALHSPPDQRVIRMWPKGAAKLCVTSGHQPQIIPSGALAWAQPEGVRTVGSRQQPSQLGGQKHSDLYPFTRVCFSFFCFGAAPGGAGVQLLAHSLGGRAWWCTGDQKGTGLEPSQGSCLQRLSPNALS